MPKQAPQHLFAAQAGIATVGGGDIADHLRLDLPDCDQFRQQGQPTQRSRRQCQRTGGERGALGGAVGQLACFGGWILAVANLAGWHLTDEIENGLGDPVVLDRCDHRGDLLAVLGHAGLRGWLRIAAAMDTAGVAAV